MGIHFGIYLVGKAHATRCGNGNLSLPPSGGGRLGWGWFLRFRYSGLNLNQYGVASPCRTICTVCGFVALS